MRKLSFGILAKIWAGISILVLAYLLSTIRNFQGLRQIEKGIEGVSAISLPASQRSRAALTYFGLAIKRCDEAAVMGNPAAIEEAEGLFKQTAAHLLAIEQMEGFDAMHREEALALHRDLEAYYEQALPFYARMSEGEQDEELMEKISGVGQTMAELHERFARLNKRINSGLLADVAGALGQSRRQMRLNMILFVLVISVSIPLVTYIIKHWVLRQIEQVVHMANRLADGDLPEALPGVSRDEIGEMERAFNRTVDAARQIVQHARRLAQGNYQIDLQPRSDQDELMLSLIRTTEALNRFAEEGRRQDWLKGGLGELSACLRGEQELGELCDRALCFVARYVGAEIGVLYLARNDRTLEVGAGFGFRDDPERPLVLKWGEGLAGEAAARQTSFRLDDVDEPVLRISSGLVEIVPRHVAIHPLVYRNETVGVIELGFVHPPTESSAELLAQATEPLAVTIRSAQAGARVRELLQETQHQSRELIRQQDALQETNADLEERTHLLEQQKLEIRRQNKDLEAARLDMERKARDLEQASKYKSEFLANMSHELRTPLNSLLILSRLMAENKTGNLTEKQTEFARTIHKSGNDLLTLINDILDLSKVEAGKMEFTIEPVDVGQLCADAKNTFQHLADEKKLGFVLEMEPGIPPKIRSDGQRLSQILRNLLSNAFKFTTSGQVAIRAFLPVAEEEGGEPMAVGFEVRDTGIGIPEEKRAQIFEAFQQADGSTSRKYGGTGLGLSISREFAKRLGGKIVVRSEAGKGSAFTLLLPVAAPEAGGATAQPVPPTAKAVEGIRDAAPSRAPLAKAADKEFILDDRGSISPQDSVVLIIEDDPKFAGVLMAFAKENGCKAVATDDGQEGVRMAENYQPLGIILDMMLPGMDGREVLGLLKENPATRQIPVHVISALDEDKQTYRLGAIGFLSKPVTPEQLQSVFSQFEAYKKNGFRRLLLVEDDAAYASSLTAMLDEFHIETVVASTGQQALDLLEQGRMDCVLLDLGLPDMSGNEVLERMVARKEPRHIPLIIHTGRDLSRSEEAHLRQFSDGIVLKGKQSVQQLLDEVSLFLHVARHRNPASSDLGAASSEKAAGPAAAAVSVSPVPASDPGAAVQLKGRKVLIVDDDMRNAYSLSAIVDGEGMETCIATDGYAALDKLKERPDMDIVLMDIMMPGLDGYQTMQKIREQARFKKLPMLALTANAMAGDREKCIEAGANDYMAKPIDAVKLLAMMRRWLARA